MYCGGDKESSLWKLAFVSEGKSSGLKDLFLFALAGVHVARPCYLNGLRGFNFGTWKRTEITVLGCRLEDGNVELIAIGKKQFQIMALLPNDLAVGLVEENGDILA